MKSNPKIFAKSSKKNSTTSVNSSSNTDKMASIKKKPTSNRTTNLFSSKPTPSLNKYQKKT
jgi:hypothetical protein